MMEEEKKKKDWLSRPGHGKKIISVESEWITNTLSSIINILKMLAVFQNCSDYIDFKIQPPESTINKCKMK